MFSNRKVQDPETCVWYGGVPMADEILKLATASLILQYNSQLLVKSLFASMF